MTERGRPVDIKARISARQHARLLSAAEAIGGNLSAALRDALRDAELLRLAREDYSRLVSEQGLRLPRNGEDGTTTLLELILAAPEALWRDE